MARVADFVTFSDFSFDLEIGGDIDRTLQETIEATPRSGEGVILMYNRRREASGSVSYTVSLNGTQISNATVSESNWHTVHEVVSTSNVRQGVNEIEFRVTSGNGRLSIGDVTLWYRQDT